MARLRGGRVRAQVSEGKTDQQKALETLQQRRDRAALEMREAVIYLLEAEQKIGAAEKVIAQAEENFRIPQERYNGQITPSAEVVDAEDLLTQAHTNYFHAIYDHHIAALALEKMTGVILD